MGVWENQRMTCPVCAYPDMPYPPSGYNICPCCGTEFGNDDAFVPHDHLRAQWLAHGAGWFYGAPPVGWNPYLQLIKGNLLPTDLQVSVSASLAATPTSRVNLVRPPDYVELVPA